MKPLSVAMNADSGEKTWLTPPHIVESLGPFDLDPCCPPNMPWRTAAQMICRPDDGLAVDWTGKRVWLNPPYGRDAIPFLRKMVENQQGGVFYSYLHAQTLRRGTIGYFHTPMAFSFCVVVCVSTIPTERPERRLRHRLRSLRTRSGILSAYATAVLQERFCTHGGHDL